MLYSKADVRKQERHLRRVRLAISRGWYIHDGKGGRYGLRDPDGNERGYQLFSTTEDAWADGWLHSFVLLWDERLMLAASHIKCAFRALVKNG